MFSRIRGVQTFVDDDDSVVETPPSNSIVEPEGAKDAAAAFENRGGMSTAFNTPVSQFVGSSKRGSSDSWQKSASKRLESAKKPKEEDVDAPDEPAKVFWESDQLRFTFGGAIPPSVLKQLVEWKQIGVSPAFTCDSKTKLACCIGNSVCYIWDMLSALNNWAPNAVQVLHLPFSSPSKDQGGKVLASLTETGELRYGLLVAEPDGVLYYWDDVKMGQGKESHRIQLNIEPGDHLISLQSSSHANYYACSAQGHIFAVSAANVHRDNSLRAVRLSQPAVTNDVLSYFQRMTGHVERAITIKLEPGHSKLLVLTEKHLQIRSTSPVLLTQSSDSVSVLSVQSLVQQLSLDSGLQDLAMGKTRLVDVAPLSANTLIALFSIPLKVQAFFPNSNKSQLVLAHVDVETVKLSRRVRLPVSFSCQARLVSADARGYGKVAVLTERDVALVNMDSLYYETLSLDGTAITANSEWGSEALYLLTLPRGVLALSLVSCPSGSLPEVGDAKLLDTELQQWALYGSDGWNPIKFNFGKGSAQADWNTALRLMCDSILKNKWRALADFSVAHKGRLLTFIVDNILRIAPSPTSLNEKSLFYLVYCAAKILSACEWKQMLEAGDAELRACFKKSLELLAKETGKLEFNNPLYFFGPGLYATVELAHQLPEVVRASEAKLAALLHANKLAISLVKTADDSIGRLSAVLNLDNDIGTEENWLSSFYVLSCLDGLFHQMTTLIFSEEDASVSMPTRAQLEAQAVDLTKVTLSVYARKHALLVDVNGAQSKEAVAFSQMFSKRRLFLLRPLVRLNKISVSIELAEKFRDFQILVELVASDADSASLLNKYIEQFGRQFAAVLFQFYADNTMYRRLLQSHPKYSAYVSEFLEERKESLSGLLWLHQLNLSQFDAATSLLSYRMTKENVRDKREMLLSLAKLASVASGDEARTANLCALEIAEDYRSLVCKAVLNSSFVSCNFELRNLSGSGIQVYEPTLGSLHLAMRDAILEKADSGVPLKLEEILDYLSLEPSLFVAGLEMLLRLRAYIDPELYKWYLTGIWRRAYLQIDWFAVDEIFKKANLRSKLVDCIIPATEVFKICGTAADAGELPLSPLRSFSFEFGRAIESHYLSYSEVFTKALQAMHSKGKAERTAQANFLESSRGGHKVAESSPFLIDDAPKDSALPLESESDQAADDTVKSAIAFRTRSRTTSEELELDVPSVESSSVVAKTTKSRNIPSKNMMTPKSQRPTKSYSTRSNRKSKQLNNERVSPLASLHVASVKSAKKASSSTPAVRKKREPEALYDPVSATCVDEKSHTTKFPSADVGGSSLQPERRAESAHPPFEDWNFQKRALLEEMRAEDKTLQTFVDQANLLNFFSLLPNGEECL